MGWEEGEVCEQELCEERVAEEGHSFEIRDRSRY